MTDTPFSLRHEEDASGVAAAVFADIRRRMSFVPAIFKALATDPPALERAWAQARALFDDPRFPATAGRLRERAAVPGVEPAAARVAAALGPFAAELPGMLLIVSSLGIALDGRVPLQPPPPLGLAAVEAPPEPTVPEARGEHPRYADVRSLYGTAHVPTLYRSLAALGLLDDAWPRIEALLGGREGREAVDRVAADGERAALELTAFACFDAERTRPVIEQFRVALPRNLVVAITLGGAT